MTEEDLSAVSDEELARRIAASPSRRACIELYGRYERRVYLWCYGYAHDRDEAVDLAQEVFIKVFKGLGGFAHRCRLATWIYQVARNHCLRAVARNRRRWRERLAPLEGDEALAAVDDAAAAACETVADLDRLLAAADRVMKPEELEAFVLHYRDGLTVNEITKTLGCENLTGARTLIQTARRKFKRLIEKKGYRDD